MEERENGRQGEDSDSIVVGNTAMSPIDVFPRSDVRRPSRSSPSSDITAVPGPVHPRTSSPTDAVLFRNGVAPEYIPQSHTQSALTPRISDVDREEATIDLKNVSINTYL